MAEQDSSKPSTSRLQEDSSITTIQEWSMPLPYSDSASKTTQGSAVDPEIIPIPKEAKPTEKAKKKVRVKKLKKKDDDELVYEAKHIMALFVPVTLCMAFVVLSVVTLSIYQMDSEIFLLYTPFHSDTKDTSTQMAEGAANAMILIVVVALMTSFLVLLVKKKYYRLLNYWMYASSAMILFFASYHYIEQVLISYNIAMDLATLTFVVWNFGVVGMLGVYGKAPLLLQQAFLICIGGFVALVFIKFLPGWNGWFVLVALVFWDIIAVMCPKGPLRQLVEMADEEDGVMPALIYSSTMVWTIVMADAQRAARDGAKNIGKDEGLLPPEEEVTTDQDDVEDDDSGEEDNSPNLTDGKKVKRKKRTRVQPQQKPRREKRKEKEYEYVEEGVHLGLGDFIFYGVLIGKASLTGDWNTIVACYVAILIGLCCTLILLAVTKQALPALPISLTFGLVFSFATPYVITPFVEKLTSEQVII